MKIHSMISTLRSELNELRFKKSLSLVPTMGALHEGHISLIEEAKKKSDVVIVSIFINPTQFNNKKDLEKYPKRAYEDLEILNDLDVDFVFQPISKELYPEEPGITIDLGNLSHKLEGKHRPGHFSGVALIVTKLFNIIQPDIALFGLKDLQQFLLIKKLCKELNIPVKVICVETKRNENGLALSSRNLRLSKNGKKLATHIYQSLKQIESELSMDIDINESKTKAIANLEKKGIEIEYLEIVETQNLDSIHQYDPNSEIAICFAGFVEGIRLIDNLYLRPKSNTC